MNPFEPTMMIIILSQIFHPPPVHSNPHSGILL